MKEEYKEILKLKKMLTDAGIPFYMHELFDGYQICYPEQNTSQNPYIRECSVIEHRGSYGHSEDKLEIMGLLTEEELQNDEVVGFLSAEEVFNRIQKDFNEKHPEKNPSVLVIKTLKALQEDPDTESAHAEADEVLCSFLETIGYEKVVEEYKKVPKWYA